MFNKKKINALIREEQMKAYQHKDEPYDGQILRIYWENPSEIGNAHIRELFGVKSNATVARMKKTVRELQVERGIKVFNAVNIDTKTAYEVWGIDVAELEKHYKKIKALGL